MQLLQNNVGKTFIETVDNAHCPLRTMGVFAIIKIAWVIMQ